MTEVLMSVLVLAGALLTLISAIGLHRFADVFARVHAAGKAAPLGGAMVFTATAIELGDPGHGAKLLLALLLLGLTFPSGMHLVVRSAYRTGTERRPDMDVDELADAVERGEAGATDPGRDPGV
ncbi:MAG: monovalent cation/H(+) antiporter subunit G [Acidimicrobiales bacterium]|nr:monovalent cation/H(+) antiporter subunit G [Acidimicrobiales bacterium]